MLTVTKTPEDLRLLEAADIAEEQHYKNLYDQTILGGQDDCGTPACLLGGYSRRHPELIATIISDTINNRRDVFKEFGIDIIGYYELFSIFGCNNAGTDGLKAAAFVRKFVEARALARLKVET